MENATKALLIAAAVLIAILLISLGVGVFNKASEQMEDADLSEYNTQKFNEKFTQYAGANVSGADVNGLIESILKIEKTSKNLYTDFCIKRANHLYNYKHLLKTKRKMGAISE